MKSGKKEQSGQRFLSVTQNSDGFHTHGIEEEKGCCWCSHFSWNQESAKKEIEQESDGTMECEITQMRENRVRRSCETRIKSVCELPHRAWLFRKAMPEIDRRRLSDTGREYGRITADDR